MASPAKKHAGRPKATKHDHPYAIEGDRGKPLMQLLRKLLDKEQNQNSLLTDSELTLIYKLEFDIDLETKGQLGTEIYLCVLKHFLRSWSQWEEFDKISNKKNLKSNMMKHYTELKEYLKANVEMTKEYLKTSNLPELKASEKNLKETKESDGLEAVLEVNCSREQLNQLFYRQVHPTLLTIFNVNPPPQQSKISLSHLTFKQIINWPNVTITIALPGFELIRRNSSHFKHTLINKKLGLNENRTFEDLSQELYKRKTQGNAHKNVTALADTARLFVDKLMNQVTELNPIMDSNTNSIVNPDIDKNKTQVAYFLSVLKNVQADLARFTQDSFCLGTDYQFYLSTTPYVRYLYSELNPAENNEAEQNAAVNALKDDIDFSKYDLQLEEVIQPAMILQISKIVLPQSVETYDYSICIQDSKINCLRVECNDCDMKFDVGTTSSVSDVEQHFTEFHKSEPDWICPTCKKVFLMQDLSESRWHHICTIKDEDMEIEEAIM